jgi:hypothetical protein
MGEISNDELKELERVVNASIDKLIEDGWRILRVGEHNVMLSPDRLEALKTWADSQEQENPVTVYVSWDGKWFGEYRDMDEAIERCRERICRDFDPTTDFDCLEFFEVAPEPPYPNTQYDECEPEHWEPSEEYAAWSMLRRAFGAAVYERGNPFANGGSR